MLANDLGINNLTMKAKNKMAQRSATDKAKLFSKHAYYFHADEDFREDWNWNKNEVANTHSHEQRSGTNKTKVTG